MTDFTLDDASKLIDRLNSLTTAGEVVTSPVSVQKYLYIRDAQVGNDSDFYRLHLKRNLPDVVCFNSKFGSTTIYVMTEGNKVVDEFVVN